MSTSPRQAAAADFPVWLQPLPSSNRPKRIAILGSTGSIGQSTLDVLRHAGIGRSGATGSEPHCAELLCSQALADDLGPTQAAAVDSDRFQLYGLSGHSQIEQLARDAREFLPPVVVCSDASVAGRWSELYPDFPGRLAIGADGLAALAADPAVDVVVAGIVGGAGLSSTLAAVEAGKVVALANKETLVIAGHLTTALAAQRQARLLPVDSEHSAIFQAMQAGGLRRVRRVVLTASGGPFLRFTAGQLRDVTPQQALAHPTWNMGAKISIDSATMMNKALEVIEARWLFGLEADQIQVMVHPQSVVHSLVEFQDGSVLAQLSPPDMRLPIQYALDFPERLAGPAEKMDFSQAFALNFEPPDMDRFPALLLGLEVARRGGSCGVVLNAANEVAVQAFLEGRIRFPRIVELCRQILNHHQFDAEPDLKTLQELDRWARQETSTCISN